MSYFFGRNAVPCAGRSVIEAVQKAVQTAAQNSFSYPIVGIIGNFHKNTRAVQFRAFQFPM
jgi:hypothetical protein